MEPNDEVLVGRHGVETRRGFQDLAGEGRKAGAEITDHGCQIRLMNFTIHGFGRAQDMASMNRRFQAPGCAVDGGKSVAGKAIVR